jgi:hypothetical protein
MQPISAALLLALGVASLGGALAGAVAEQSAAVQHMNAQFESPAYRVISDEDRALMQQVKNQIEDDFSSFKDVDEVHKFLDKVKLLVQKHPKNVAFAQGDLKELHKFLSQEMVTKLIRVDTMPFEMPISDERMVFAQRAVDEDELTRKLFGGPLRSLAEAKRQHHSRTEDGNHRDGNFFSNFWCKISGNCSN